MRDLTIRQAEQLLEELRPAPRASRDDTVRTAYASGVRKSRIAELAGISRRTVDRILATGAPCDDP